MPRGKKNTNVEHGTDAGAQYCADGTMGGRCESCRDAHKESVARWRANNKSAADKQKLRQNARNAAFKALVAAHPEEFDAYFLEEMKRGSE